MKQVDVRVLVVHTKAYKWEAQTVLFIIHHFSQVDMMSYAQGGDRRPSCTSPTSPFDTNSHIPPGRTTVNPFAKCFREPWPRARHRRSTIPGRQKELTKHAYYGPAGPCQEPETLAWERLLVPHCCKEAAQQRLETTHHAVPPG